MRGEDPGGARRARCGTGATASARGSARGISVARLTSPRSPSSRKVRIHPGTDGRGVRCRQLRRPQAGRSTRRPSRRGRRSAVPRSPTAGREPDPPTTPRRSRSSGRHPGGGGALAEGAVRRRGGRGAARPFASSCFRPRRREPRATTRRVVRRGPRRPVPGTRARRPGGSCCASTCLGRRIAA